MFYHKTAIPGRDSIRQNPDPCSCFVQIWDISGIAPIKKESLADVACSRMIDNLNEALWSALFGNKEYRLLCPNLQD